VSVSVSIVNMRCRFFWKLIYAVRSKSKSTPLIKLRKMNLFLAVQKIKTQNNADVLRLVASKENIVVVVGKHADVVKVILVFAHHEHVGFTIQLDKIFFVGECVQHVVVLVAH
jgi:hypothetical protein